MDDDKLELLELLWLFVLTVIMGLIMGMIL